jgi:hypothetical protein
MKYFTVFALFYCYFHAAGGKKEEDCYKSLIYCKVTVYQYIFLWYKGKGSASRIEQEKQLLFR